MGKRHAMKWLVSLIVFSVLFAVVAFGPQATKAGVTAPVKDDVLKGNEEKDALYSSKDILQFRSGGLILGFREDRMYMVGMGYALIEEFVGAKKVKPLAGGGEQAEEKEGKGAPAFHGVTYPGLWEGIDLRYKAEKGGLAESVFEIRPHADPGKIMLKYNAEVEVQKDGSLKITPPNKKGYFTMSAPKAWQEIRGKRVPVEVAFREIKDNTVGFRVAEYNRDYPLVIDPSYQWHTFYGSAEYGTPGSDNGNAIAVDGSGNVYVTGYSNATWNGPSGESPLHAHSGSHEIFVLKLNSSGAYQWHTFYGSENDDWGGAIAVDSSGYAYVTGWTDSSDFPTQNAFQGSYAGDDDAFVTKLSPSGDSLIYSTYLIPGGSDVDAGLAIAVDSSGNAYMTGYTDSSDFPTQFPTQGSLAGSGNAFVVKIGEEGLGGGSFTMKGRSRRWIWLGLVLVGLVRGPAWGQARFHRFQRWLIAGLACMLMFTLFTAAHAQKPLPFQTQIQTQIGTTKTSLDMSHSESFILLGVDSGANDGSSTLLRIFDQTGAGTVIGETGFVVTDIAFTPDGRLFGVTFDQLLVIDPSTGTASPVGTGLGIFGTNALVSNSKGELFSATFTDGRFVKIDPQTGIATVIGSYGSGLVSSGGLAFAPDGTLFGVAAGYPSDLLIKVNPETGEATVIGPIGFREVFGIAFDAEGILFGGANGGPGSIPTLIVIDTQTGSGRAIGTITNANGLFGLTSVVKKIGGGSFTITTPGDMPLADKAVSEPFQIKVTAQDARGGY